MNRGQLKLRVSRVLGIGLGTGDDEVDETAFLDELANEAVLDILQRTRVHVRRALVLLDEGATEFDIDTSVLKIWGIHRGTETNDVTFMYQQGRDEMTPEGFAFPGFTRIAVGQAGASGGEWISVWHTPAPLPMTDDAHDPSDEAYGRIPPQFHRAILNYMCWHAADKSGDREAGRGERYRVLYEGSDGMAPQGSDLGQIKVAVNTQGSRIRIRSFRRRLISDLDSAHWQG